MRPKKQRKPMSLAGLGMELGAAVIGFTVVGYWIGSRYDKTEWGVVIGASLGIVGGLYNFIRAALKASKASEGSQTTLNSDAAGGDHES